MLEMSLAHNIVESITESVGKDRLTHVRAVQMEIGSASGVESESLVFAFDAIVKDSPLSSAYIVAEVIPFVVHCNDCQIDTINETGFMMCSHCGSNSITIVSGTELALKNIELNDDLKGNLDKLRYH